MLDSALVWYSESNSSVNIKLVESKVLKMLLHYLAAIPMITSNEIESWAYEYFESNFPDEYGRLKEYITKK
jgi:hypothetical protein